MRAASVCPQYGAPGQSPAARETRVMPDTMRRESPPDGWPETPPTYRSTHGGALAVAHLVAVTLTALAVAWCACEVRLMREAIRANARMEAR